MQLGVTQGFLPLYILKVKWHMWAFSRVHSSLATQKMPHFGNCPGLLFVAVISTAWGGEGLFYLTFPSHSLSSMDAGIGALLSEVSVLPH